MGLQVNAVRTSVGSNASAVELLAAEKRRIGWCIFNQSTQVLYLAFGASPAPSATDFSVAIAAGGYYEPPLVHDVASCAVWGIWAGANGAARITAFV